MLLAVAATEFEMKPLTAYCRLPHERLGRLVSGVGPMESAVKVMRFIGRYHTEIEAIVNFGIGGAYPAAPGEAGAGLLDVCLAEREVLGDFGICYGNAVEPFGDHVPVGMTEYRFDPVLVLKAEACLAASSIAVCRGTFVTVNGASGTLARGNSLKQRYRAICENMEGAAVARCCAEYGLPMVEVRAVSNLVEDRPSSAWRLDEACELAARAAACICHALQEEQ